MFLWLTANNSKCTHFSGPLLCFPNASHDNVWVTCWRSHVDLLHMLVQYLFFYYALRESLVLFLLGSYIACILSVRSVLENQVTVRKMIVYKGVYWAKNNNVVSLICFKFRIFAVFIWHLNFLPSCSELHWTLSIFYNIDLLKTSCFVYSLSTWIEHSNSYDDRACICFGCMAFDMLLCLCMLHERLVVGKHVREF